MKAAGLAEKVCAFPIAPRRAQAPLSVGVVLAAWDIDSAATSLDLLEEHRRRLAGVDWHLVVVANNEEVGERLRPRPGLTVVAGSNREAEFSAYEEGRSHLIEELGIRPGVWMIVNDRLPVYGTRYLEAVTPGLLRFASGAPLATGHLDSFARPFTFWGHRLAFWARSNWVLVSAAALDRIGPICGVTADRYDEQVPRSWSGEGWPLSTWLGADAGENLRAWLTQPDGWARAEPISAESWPRLRAKAMAIVNEWLLSARLMAAGTAVVPWRQARVLSEVEPGSAFAGRFLRLLREAPELALGMAKRPRARIELATAVLVSRGGFEGAGRRLLSSSARSGAAWLRSFGGPRP